MNDRDPIGARIGVLLMIVSAAVSFAIIVWLVP
jgi:hypothetical protein